MFACDDDNKKLDLLEEIKSILFQLKFDLGTSSYVSAMCDLAIGYSELGRVNEVLEIEDSIKVDFDISNYFANNKTKYANYLNSIATCKFSMGNYQESIKLGLRALDIYRKEYGLDAGKYENTILNLMSCYGNLKDTANLFSIIKNTNILECIKKELSPNMHLLSSNNRNKYWNVFSPIFCDMLPLLAVLSNDSAFVCDAYDMSALFSKGLLLKTEIELLDFIKKHGDSTLQIEYTNLLSSYEKLAKTNDIIETDSLKAVINRQEDKIRQNMYERGRVIDTKVSWKDIQERLGAKDVAIEFLTSNTDTFQLNSALLLRKGYRYPKMIPLCNMKQLEKSLSQWQNDSLYTLLWQPIENEIDNVENIYFSPAGALNNLPMEYLLCPDGQYMCEKYGMYRLSSTQELLKKKSNAKIKKAVLFGGLDYDLDITNGHSPSLKESKFTQQERELRESFLSRSGFDPLLNTLLEITEVSNLLEGNKVQCAIFKGNEGVENSLKKLSGSSIDIIHISTHGMYIEANETTKMKQKNNFDFIRTNNISSVAIEDAALSRSFLVMSGGNMLTRHKLIPEGIDDGILTSLEISHLDLFGTNLVVLSACQTGLGDVTSEGVYGLQRGFKKAGAKTILMSLDKVDDEATRILMVEFYKNLMSGKTKHQSLRDAQQYLRKVDNGKYDAPKYWASFIMLDGID